MLKACLSYEDHACDMWQWGEPWHKTWRFCPWEPVSSLAQDTALSENAFWLTNSDFLHSFLLPLLLPHWPPVPIFVSWFCPQPSCIQCPDYLGYPATGSHQTPSPSTLEVISDSVPGSWGFSLVLPTTVWPWLVGLLTPCRVRGQLDSQDSGESQNLSWMKGSSSLVFVVLVLDLLYAQASCTEQVGPAWLPSSNHTSHLRW